MILQTDRRLHYECTSDSSIMLYIKSFSEAQETSNSNKPDSLLPSCDGLYNLQVLLYYIYN